LTGGFGFEIHYGGSFLHSRNACNWHNNFVVEDSNKSDLLYRMLSDIIDDKTKNYLELVVARHEEDLKWAKNYGDFTTIYNKGESEVEGSIKLLPKPIVGSAGTVTTDSSCTDQLVALIPSSASSISLI